MLKQIGIGVILVCVLGGFMMAGGKVIALWQPAELIIIIGAAVGSMMLGNEKSVLIEMKHQLKQVFKPNKEEKELYRELLTLMHQLLEETRNKGLKALDEHIENPQQSSVFLMYPQISEDPQLLGFIIDNLRLLGMGKISPHELDTMLEQEIMAIEEDLLKPAHALHKTGEACPGFGILAAVMGIIITMQQLDGPLANIGVHVAAALVGTFIGIFLCYCLLEPLSSAMEEQVKRRIGLMMCIKSILLAQLRGKLPLLAVDAGRKVLEPEVKPSFLELEEWVTNRAM
ncbi:lateral flagellar motor stator protein LafT [Aeromonas schubertii]|uniref:LafT n=1 Tax=Aeromonas schubertii TaxID=652 RepID=A0A0S2SK98_9GAMM|nr:lateral flagellar motor stator protein LafT [Aeromonas schubertii]ALP42054.1 LafT [Aeromonas schubertii]KUE80676.1 flagellar motor stator protein MotA [Aeromonas schubertii]MBZ6067075.1 lateral flagellar motor stator protein LafT [Aeromonas schubertii]MBZ6074125.1 lateral flagellar motor stator protein LafT [Aeromonas schubertii]